MTAAHWAVPFLLMLQLGCSRTTDETTRQSTTAPALDLSGATLEVRASSGADTVRIMGVEGKRYLLWTTRIEAKRVERLRSGDLLMGDPEVLLGDFTQDSIPDLFVRFAFEEMVSAVAYSGTQNGGISIAYSSAGRAQCMPGELRDVSRDGLPDIVEFLPGAVTEEDCTGSGPYEACVDAFPVTWKEAWIQSPGGTFAPDSMQAQTFYAARAAEYRHALERIRTSKADTSGNPLCPPSVEEQLELMARRAEGRVQ